MGQHPRKLPVDGLRRSCGHAVLAVTGDIRYAKEGVCIGCKTIVPISESYRAARLANLSAAAR